MNHRSERQSPAGSTACSRHCNRRWVFVNVPAFSTCVAAGSRNTSVPMSSVRRSPVSISGLSRQNEAVSTSTRSRTTSHFRPASALRFRRPLTAPTVGFWPMTKKPSTSPSSMPWSVG